MQHDTRKSVSKYLPYALLTLLIYITFFWRLDGVPLWRDEATTACWGRVLAESSSLTPKVLHEEQLIAQGSRGHDFNEKYQPSMQGWLQLYISALAFKIFGTSTLTARLPFAILGAAGLIFIFFLSRNLFQSRKWAMGMVFISALSLPYLHYARQSRYYALVLLLTFAIFYEVMPRLKAGTQKINTPFFLRIGVYGLLLFFTNYFSFGIFWIGLLLSMFMVNDKNYAFGMIVTTFILGLFITPVLLSVHSSFISRAEITQIAYAADYLDWLLMSLERCNHLFPIIPLLLLGIFLLWRYPKHTLSLKKVYIFLWLMFVSTLLVSVFINKSNAFLRYYLHMIPVALLIMGITIFWIYSISGRTIATILSLILFLYHSWTPVINHSESIMKRQFMKDDSVNQPMINFLRENTSEDESVTFIPNDKGIVAYFYLPWLKWYGILENRNPNNQIYKKELTPAMFDNYPGIDWVVVWGVLGLPARVEQGYELTWHYRYGKDKADNKVEKNLYTPTQYTITQAEAGISEELKYYDFYKKN